MKTKWNWGTKLVIWIVAFVVFILSLVYMSLSYDVNLVEKDYYPKGLKYQSRIDAIENAKSIDANVNIIQNGNNLNVIISNIQPDSGNVTLFRPSDVSFDRKYELEPNTTALAIPVSDLTNGKYIVKCNWWQSGNEYYVEQVYSIK